MAAAMISEKDQRRNDSLPSPEEIQEQLDQLSQKMEVVTRLQYMLVDRFRRLAGRVSRLEGQSLSIQRRDGW